MTLEPTITLENEIIHNLIHDPEYFTAVIPYLKPKYFSNLGNNKIFEKIQNFYYEYHEKPNLKDIILSLKNESKKIREEAVKSIKEIETSQHSSKTFMKEETEDFIKKAIHKEALIIGSEGIGQNDESKLLKSYELIEEAMKVTLFEDFGLNIQEIDKMVDYLNEDYDGLLTGITTIDEMLGKGIYSKSLTTFLAPPGIGKSMAMVAFGSQFLKQKKDVIFISLEMNEYEVMKRVYANLMDIEVNLLDKIDPIVLKEKFNNLDIGTLTIKEFPSYSITALNIESYLEKYAQQTGIEKPIVFVDYLGLMNSARLAAGKVNSYELVKSITAELRAIAQKRDLKIFTAHQLNRSAVNNIEAGQETVADSAGISAFSDAMIFLLSTKEMKRLGRIVINFEKNRYSGKTYSFEIGVVYSKMKFVSLEGDCVIKEDEHGLPIKENPFKL